MTAHGTIETAIEATKLGAYDYLQKPFEMPELIGLLHRAAEASRLMREPVTLPNAPVESRTALVGTSRGTDAVRQTLAARDSDPAATGKTFAAAAADLLGRAQKREMQDAHARLLAEAEREILAQAITLAGGNQAKAARWLGLSRFTLREKLKQLGLHPDSTETNPETDS